VSSKGQFSVPLDSARQHLGREQAGLGYGAAYYLTGRIHCAVLLHFAVNAVHQLLLAGAPAAANANLA